MIIRIGQVFQYQQKVNDTFKEYEDFYELTKGKYSTGIGSGGQGIFHYSEIKDISGIKRIPAFILSSNPFKEGTTETPWVDMINAEEGYAIYNGDNKSSSHTPDNSSGNKALMNTMSLYTDPSKRALAPPILIFRQEVIKGKRKGFRSFQGYGIPVNTFIRTQKDIKSGKYFTNLVFEIALLSLNQENEKFNWEWISQRRDSSKTSDETLTIAPKAWKLWVKNGNEQIEQVRRRVVKKFVYSKSEQSDISLPDKKILQSIYEYYLEKRHPFEGLAIEVLGRVLGNNFIKGWITKPSGDMGIDFVGRLDIGDNISRTKIPVLGQAKCILPFSSITAHDLSRIVARLQRGWIGAFVTTGLFSNSAQEEMYIDKYPVTLINGKRLVQEIKQMMAMDNIDLESLLNNSTEWYNENIRLIPPSRIIDWEFPQIVDDNHS